MKNKICTTILASLLLISCNLNPSKNNTSLNQAFIKGSVVYNGKTSLPENAQVIVRINDISLVDAASVT